MSTPGSDRVKVTLQLGITSFKRGDKMHPSHLVVLFPLNPGVGEDHQISLRPEQALSQSQLIRKTS